MQTESSISKSVCKVRLCALMSIPRAGFNDHWGCVFDALGPLHIPVKRYIGVYWSQCLQNALEDCIAEGYEWVMTLDYDTLFTDTDVKQMLAIFYAHPQHDALAGLQTKRTRDSVLVTLLGETELETDGTPVKIDGAHFGMTLFRLNAFAKVPKPWFLGAPGEGGSWQGKGFRDPDVWFWERWKEHGNNVYLAPNIRLGHLEMMASHVNDDGLTEYVHVQEWFKRRRECESAAE